MAICAGIKKIVYDDVTKITEALDATKAATIIKAAITAGNVVPNVHQETWSLDESESSPTGYKNQLNGKTYRYDKPQAGDLTPSWTIGQYDWKSKATFMGGKVVTDSSSLKDIGWERGDKENINKALFCLTDDDVWFIFPNCLIDAREANTDKAIAIAVKGYVQEHSVAGVANEYNFEESSVKALTV